jgi:uncharacterized protein Yka (UPF0111/DUF47 family)
MQRLLKWMLPRDDRFFTLLEQHGEALGEAAAVLSRFVAGAATPADSRAEMRRVAQRGDELAHAVTIALDETFVTPIDRQDLHHLATSLDHVLDFLDAAVDAFVSYEVHGFTPAMRELIQLCTEAAQLLSAILPSIRKRQLAKLAPARLQIIAWKKRGDTAYRTESAALYKDPGIDAKGLLRHQAVLHALAAALDSCQEAADVLENVAIKHS